MRLLTRRDHSESEIIRKLTASGFESDLIVKVIVRLKELGFIDDRRFARLWADAAVRNRRAFGPKLRAELSSKGIQSEIIGQTLQHLAETTDEKEAAITLVQRKFPDFDPCSAPVNLKRRIYNFLLRRGLSPATATAIMKLRERPADSGD